MQVFKRILFGLDLRLFSIRFLNPPPIIFIDFHVFFYKIHLGKFGLVAAALNPDSVLTLFNPKYILI